MADHITNDDCLKVTAMFGSNSFGKSNFIKGLKTLKKLVTNKFYKSDDPIHCWFSNNDVTSFDIEFIYNGMQYQYHLAVVPRGDRNQKLLRQFFTYAVEEECLYAGVINKDCIESPIMEKVFEVAGRRVNRDDESIRNLLNEEMSLKKEISDIETEIDSLKEELAILFSAREIILKDVIDPNITNKEIKQLIVANNPSDYIEKKLVSLNKALNKLLVDYDNNTHDSEYVDKNVIYSKIEQCKNKIASYQIFLEHERIGNLNDYLIRNDQLLKKYKDIDNDIKTTEKRLSSIRKRYDDYLMLLNKNRDEQKRIIVEDRDVRPVIATGDASYCRIENKNLFTRTVPEVFNWFMSTLVILETDDFHLPLNRDNILDDLSEIVSSLDMGIYRLKWEDPKKEKNILFPSTGAIIGSHDVGTVDGGYFSKYSSILADISSSEVDRLKKCRENSLKNSCEVSTIVKTESECLYRFSYWCGEETVKEMTVQHTPDSEKTHPMIEESDGTIRMIELASILLPSKQEKIFIVDELDRRLHPAMTRRFIDLFMNRYSENKQLVFSSHETLLLTTDIFRKDEIWFVVKDDNGESELIALDEIKTIDRRIEKMFLEGSLPGAPRFD